MICKHNFKFYDGALGYESLKCTKCHRDINEIKEKLVYTNGTFQEVQ